MAKTKECCFDSSSICWPGFENYTILKCAVLQVAASKKTDYAIVELQHSTTAFVPYRIYSENEILFDGEVRARYPETAELALSTYGLVYDAMFRARDGATVAKHLPDGVGSPLLRAKPELYYDFVTCGYPDVDNKVISLVESLWAESVGTIQGQLTQPLRQISNEKIEEAESLLNELKRHYQGHDVIGEDDVTRISAEFYNTLPHRFTVPLCSLSVVANKLDLCQLLRDMIRAAEASDWEPDANPYVKYSSLKCRIEPVNDNDPNIEKIKKMVEDTQERNNIQFRLYAIRRYEERESKPHTRLLFHGSKNHNIIGILSRGLLPPDVVVEEYGVTKTDRGQLGPGLYFTDSISSAIKYSSPMAPASRYCVISEVELGESYFTNSFMPHLVEPPKSCGSVYGYAGANSDFTDDEYVVYDKNRQILKYLMEFWTGPNVRKEDNVPKHIIPPVVQDSVSVDVDSLLDVEVDDVEVGLVATQAGSVVPLKSVHVKAALLDLAAKVIVYQTYVNECNSPIEAKYVFPLDELAVVCGFEAFINDKHIVGVVKDKQTAHREYREAIEKGHGAYLMDKDVETPDVFTVSVGNIPPQATVLIKITYVSELPLLGDYIDFKLPASVAPWKRQQAQGHRTQSRFDTLTVDGCENNFSVQMCVDMAYPISYIKSTSHTIKLKQTVTKAVVELEKNQGLGEGFQLLVGMEKMHVPRMWVERNQNFANSQACMLTFYPEFEVESSSKYNVLVILDCSNSMSAHLDQAKALALLTLSNLPDACRWNIVKFASGFEELFPNFVRKIEKNVERGEEFIQSTTSGGNTNFKRLLYTITRLSSNDIDRPTNLVLISDGHVTFEGDSLLADLNNKGTRLFACGVGNSPNHFLLRQMSNVSSGVYQYFNPKTKSKWRKQMTSLVKKCREPVLSSVSIIWHQYDEYSSRPLQAPANITAVFKGSRLVVYGFVDNCTKATLRARINGKEFTTFVSTTELSITTGEVVHLLTARAVIEDWQNGVLDQDRSIHEKTKRNRKIRMISLSKEYSIVTPFTSFVAVEERQEGESFDGSVDVEAIINEDDVDVLSYMGWDVVTAEDYQTPVEEEESVDVSSSESGSDSESESGTSSSTSSDLDSEISKSDASTSSSSADEALEGVKAMFEDGRSRSSTRSQSSRQSGSSRSVSPELSVRSISPSLRSSAGESSEDEKEEELEIELRDKKKKKKTTDEFKIMEDEMCIDDQLYRTSITLSEYRTSITLSDEEYYLCEGSVDEELSLGVEFIATSDETSRMKVSPDLPVSWRAVPAPRFRARPGPPPPSSERERAQVEVEDSYAPVILKAKPKAKAKDMTRTDPPLLVPPPPPQPMLQSTRQVDEIRSVMVSNIDKVLERGDRLAELQDKTEALSSAGKTFYKSAKAMRESESTAVPDAMASFRSRTAPATETDASVRRPFSFGGAGFEKAAPPALERRQFGAAVPQQAFAQVPPPPPPPASRLFGTAAPPPAFQQAFAQAPQPPPPPASRLFGTAAPAPAFQQAFAQAPQPPPPPATGLFGTVAPPSAFQQAFNQAPPPFPGLGTGLFGAAALSDIVPGPPPPVMGSHSGGSSFAGFGGSGAPSACAPPFGFRSPFDVSLRGVFPANAKYDSGDQLQSAFHPKQDLPVVERLPLKKETPEKALTAALRKPQPAPETPERASTAALRKPQPAPESQDDGESDEDDDMGFGLFDDDYCLSGKATRKVKPAAKLAMEHDIHRSIRAARFTDTRMAPKDAEKLRQTSERKGGRARGAEIFRMPKSRPAPPDMAKSVVNEDSKAELDTEISIDFDEYCPTVPEEIFLEQAKAETQLKQSLHAKRTTRSAASGKKAKVYWRPFPIQSQTSAQTSEGVRTEGKIDTAMDRSKMKQKSAPHVVEATTVEVDDDMGELCQEEFVSYATMKDVDVDDDNELCRSNLIKACLDEDLIFDRYESPTTAVADARSKDASNYLNQADLDSLMFDPRSDRPTVTYAKTTDVAPPVRELPLLTAEQFESIGNVIMEKNLSLLNEEFVNGILPEHVTCDVIKSVLVASGIKSLGSIACEEITTLILYLIVLYRIMKAIIDSKYNDEPELRREIVDFIDEGLDFNKLMKLIVEYEEEEGDEGLSYLMKAVLRLVNKYPGIYYRLELGRNWVDAIEYLIGVNKPFEASTLTRG